MKIYEYIKGENKKIIKLFGKTIMSQIYNYVTAEKNQEFFEGLITAYKISESTDNGSYKEIKILGKSIIKRKEKDNLITYFLFGIKYYQSSLFSKLKKQCFKYFSKEHDDIYILKANSGEIYLILTYIIDALIKKNGSKKPLLVATQKYHIDMIKMICPDIPYVYIENFKLKLIGYDFKIDNFRFFLLFDSTHFRQVEHDIRESALEDCHYFKSMLARFQINENDLGMRKINVLPEAKHAMLEKVKQIGLNLDKFVFLTPEAKSCKSYDADFWCKLINVLQNLGYDVFVNIIDNEIDLNSIKNYKTCFLTYSEAFALACYAKKIVSLRSGFTEFLIQTGVPIDILYTKFKNKHLYNNLDSAHVMAGFTVSKIPNVNMEKIKEFNMFEISPSQCINEILSDLK